MDLQSAWRLISDVSDAARRREESTLDNDCQGDAFAAFVVRHQDAEKAALSALTGIPADRLEYVGRAFGYAAAEPSDGDAMLAAMAGAFLLPDEEAEINAIPSVVTFAPVAIDLHEIDSMVA